jgi:hypothetical protein
MPCARGTAHCVQNRFLETAAKVVSPQRGLPEGTPGLRFFVHKKGAPPRTPCEDVPDAMNAVGGSGAGLLVASWGATGRTSYFRLAASCSPCEPPFGGDLTIFRNAIGLLQSAFCESDRDGLKHFVSGVGHSKELMVAPTCWPTSR